MSEVDVGIRPPTVFTANVHYCMHDCISSLGLAWLAAAAVLLLLTDVHSHRRHLLVAMHPFFHQLHPQAEFHLELLGLQRDKAQNLRGKIMVWDESPPIQWDP